MTRVANRSKKSEMVDRLSDRLAKAHAVYLTDFTGLKVKNMTDLRRRFRKAGAEYVVVKNTLAVRALERVAIDGLKEALAGPTAFVFAESDPVAAAKILAEFQKEFERPQVKLGLVEGRVISAPEVQRLAALPPREGLLSQVAGALEAPLSGFVHAVNGLFYQMVAALEALHRQKSGAE
ncbi:MAG: 50S ribosomal protein L10 [Gemmatimonadales bacterium]|nr:50S ribosomal protein L10 [bacterium HR33]GIW51680.1 MAG: 50S ribosomal protein L10 [Gemmatimonadales bacterium]